MIATRRPPLAPMILGLVACSTQHLDGDEVTRLLDPYATAQANMLAGVPAEVGNLRVKVDGRFLVWDDNRKFDYYEVLAGVHEFFNVPSNMPLELVSRDGQWSVQVGPLVPFSTGHTYAWVHSSPNGGLTVDILNLLPDHDDTTAEIRAMNVSAGEPVIVYRCAGSIACAGCPTTPSNQDPFGAFPLSDCQALVTLHPGEQWTSTQEPTSVTAGSGAACLAVQDLGSSSGPTYAMEMNRPSAGYNALSYILIDGVSPSIVSDVAGNTFRYPGVFVLGENQ